MDSTFWEALELAKDKPNTPTAITQVAKATSQEASRWAFTQVALREKAKQKFSHPEKLLFVREALEQASHEQVAEFHASFFPKGVLVGDLCAGIGSDSLALSRRGPVASYEFDPERAEVLRYNLNALGGEQWSVREQDSLVGEWDFEYAFADPARRVNGVRTLNLEAFSPNPYVLAERTKSLRLGVIKLSPMLSDDALHSLGSGGMFVSYGGECREALVFVGLEAPKGWKALQIETGYTVDWGVDAPRTEQVEAYFYEADPAFIRGHALGELADQFELYQLGETPGYLTGSSKVESPVLSGYLVLHSDSFDFKRLSQYLKQKNFQVEAVKQRGANLDLETLKKRLPKGGSSRVILAFYVEGKSTRVVVLSRLLA